MMQVIMAFDVYYIYDVICMCNIFFFCFIHLFTYSLPNIAISKTKIFFERDYDASDSGMR